MDGAGHDDALPAAVVFDCDGTLVDSETVTRTAMRRALAEQGVMITDTDFAGFVGHPWHEIQRRMQRRWGMDDAAIERYSAALARHAGPAMQDPALVFDDVRATLDALDEAAVPMAVCTSSSRDHLARVLTLPGLVDRFPVRVAREDVPRHKPDPLPYAESLRLLGASTGRALDPARCTVVEDSGPGVAAGRAAGCWTVGVARPGPTAHDLSRADVVVDRVTLAVLRPGRSS